MLQNGTLRNGALQDGRLQNGTVHIIMDWLGVKPNLT